MPLTIVRNDITKMNVDAIVNAANNSLLGGGGVDGCIHRAAGPQLLEECRTLNGCETGDAKITKGYNLPCRYVIHTVGPVWYGGTNNEEALLVSCYRKSLQLAVLYQCESIAFPLISSGIYGYPKDQALKVAVNTITEFLSEHDMMVYIVVFDRKAYTIGEALYTDIQSYIDNHYVDAMEASDGRRSRGNTLQQEEFHYTANYQSRERITVDQYLADFSLSDALSSIDESFSEMLMRKIRESGMSDAQCYKKANIDRKLFSKIRSDSQYKPSKPTVIAFGLALELSLNEMNEMLNKAGFALSHSSVFDIIIEYYVKQGNYNVYEINEALFAFDQSLIGSK